MKIDTETINSTYIRTDGADALFPRNDHPDDRTEKQFLEIINGKKERIAKRGYTFIKKSTSIEPPKLPYSNRKRVLCIETGQEYRGVGVCARSLDINKRNLSAHMNGTGNKTVGGMTFKLIE